MGENTYLYGDSTDSGLTINYIELLRDFLDFAAQLMLSEHRITIARGVVEDKTRTMDKEMSRLQELGELVLKTLESAKRPDSKSATEKCIASLSHNTQETLRNAASGLKRELLSAEQELGANRKRERAANARIIEHLLLNHELPDSTNDVDITLNADGTGYKATVNGKNQQGLHWRFLAEVPQNSPFSALRKVSALSPEMTISLPEMSGFVRKSVKLKPYRVFPMYVCALTHRGRDILLQLRSSPQGDDDTGLDILWSSQRNAISVVRMQRGDTSPSYDVEGADVEVLSELVRTLSEESFPLIQSRSKLIEILFNERPLAECEAPTDLIARLVARIGPVIRGIVEHSLGEKELVLKRVLANDRREEIFTSKVDLLEKLSVVPAEMRGIFAPLGIGDLGTPEMETVDSADVVESLDEETVSDRAETYVRPETTGVSIEIEVLDIEDQVMEASTALPLTKTSNGIPKVVPDKGSPVSKSDLPPLSGALAPALKGLQSIPRRKAPLTMPPRKLETLPKISAQLPTKKAKAASIDDTLIALDEEQPLTPLPSLKPKTTDISESMDIDIALAGLEIE